MGTVKYLIDYKRRDKNMARQRVAHDNPTFRTPVWNLDGSGFLYSTPNSSDGVTLWRSPREGEGRVAITTLDGNTNLLRAPRSDLVAVLPATADGKAGGVLLPCPALRTTLSPVDVAAELISSLRSQAEEQLVKP